MGETLEYLESLFYSGDYQELENCGECLADWDCTCTIVKQVKADLRPEINPTCPYCGGNSHKNGKGKDRIRFNANSTKITRLQAYAYRCTKCKSCFTIYIEE